MTNWKELADRWTFKCKECHLSLDLDDQCTNEDCKDSPYYEGQKDETETNTVGGDV